MHDLHAPFSHLDHPHLGGIGSKVLDHIGGAEGDELEAISPLNLANQDRGHFRPLLLSDVVLNALL